MKEFFEVEFEEPLSGEAFRNITRNDALRDANDYDIADGLPQDEPLSGQVGSPDEILRPRVITREARAASYTRPGRTQWVRRA